VKDVLFYRDFTRFTGGHLKLWHYFNHVRSSGTHWPHVWFTERSLWDDTNPWWPMKDEVASSWQHRVPSVLFLEGNDWRRLDEPAREESAIPILNLIQGFRHADPARGPYGFLRHKAVRICVSAEVKEAILATDRVNGPVFVIPNGLDLPTLAPRQRGQCDVLVVGFKNQELARQVHDRVRILAADTELLDLQLPRPAFLEALQHARVTVFLPKAREGFYLPALEAMAIGTLVVCPDVVGNRSFCLPGHNCLRPEYGLEEIVRATAAALALSPERRAAMLANAAQTARAHDMDRERKEFLAILENVGDLWRNTAGQGGG
jgi:glycosyltransferase involved in cell wall biosynthesis